jgi:hypothetical protein
MMEISLIWRKQSEQVTWKATYRGHTLMIVVAEYGVLWEVNPGMSMRGYCLGRAADFQEAEAKAKAFVDKTEADYAATLE